MNDLQPIPFHSDTIYLVNHEGQPVTPVKPIIENIGIDWMNQYVKLTSKKERWGIVLVTIPSAGGPQETICIPIRKLAAFLYSIDADRVRPDLRDKVLMYQNECDEVLWNYWTKGVAVNDRTLAGVILVNKDKYVELLEEQNRLLRLEQTVMVQQASTRKNFTQAEDAMVLALHEQGLSQGEIGKRIGRKKASVHSCLHRLRTKGGNA